VAARPCGNVDVQINSYSTSSSVSTEMGDHLHNQPIRPTQPPTLSGMGNKYQPRGSGSALQQEGNRKERNEYLYSAILVRTYILSKRSDMDHSFTCKQHHACLSFVSIHQMALPLTEAADIELQLTTHLSTPKG